MSMFTPDAYNKYNKNTRIANWQEEISLGEFTNSQRRPLNNNYAERTITHTEQELPKDYKSVSHFFHDNPSDHKDFLKMDPEGPKKKIIEQQRYMTATHLNSTNRVDFVSYDNNAFAKSTRRTQDLVPTQIDPNLMAEHGLRMLKSKLGDEELHSYVPKQNLVESVPITMYTQRIAEHLYAGTASDGLNPLGRSSKLTNDLNDGTKYHSFYVDKPHKLPSGLKDHPVTYMASDLTTIPLLEEYRNRLLEISGPSGLIGLKQTFNKLDKDNSGIMDKSQFTTALIDIGLNPSQTDIQIIYSYFDSGKLGCFKYDNFFDYFIIPMNQCRQEAVKNIFNYLDKDNHGTVSFSFIRNSINPYKYFLVQQRLTIPSHVMNDFNNSWIFLENPEQVTLADFINYFSSLSYLISDDSTFVNVLTEFFNIPPPPKPEGRKIFIYNLKGQAQLYEFEDTENIGNDPILIQNYLRTKKNIQDIDYIKILN